MYEIQNLYVENIPKNVLLEFLSNLKVKRYLLFYAFIIHDKDIKANGELKKPHYHLMIDIDDNTHHAKEHLISIFSELDKHIRVKNIRSLQKFARYLQHLDNKEKMPYSKDLVVSDDIDYYDELCEKVIKISATSELLENFISCIENDSIKSDRDIFQFFRDFGNLNFYICHTKQLRDIFHELTKDKLRQNAMIKLNKVVCRDENGDEIFDSDLPF